MTLNASGPISLGGSTSGQSVNLELGQSATAQISFNDANVRTLTATTAGTALVMPTNFYGKSSVVVDFNFYFIFAANFGGAQAGYGIFGAGGNIGTAYEFVNYGPTFLEQWITPTTTAGDYEVYATFSGDTPSGTFNSWVALSGNPSWDLVASGSGITRSCSLNFDVRKIGTTTVLDTWGISLQASGL